MRTWESFISRFFSKGCFIFSFSRKFEFSRKSCFCKNSKKFFSNNKKKLLKIWVCESFQETKKSLVGLKKFLPEIFCFSRQKMVSSVVSPCFGVVSEATYIFFVKNKVDKNFAEISSFDFDFLLISRKLLFSWKREIVLWHDKVRNKDARNLS